MDGVRNTVLVVEDEAFVGWDLCDMLQDEGYETLGPAPTIDAAMEIIDTAVPSLAILDINLGKTTVWPVAERLASLSVPIIFSTADSGHRELRERFADTPLLPKPVSRTALIGAVSRTVEA